MHQRFFFFRGEVRERESCKDTPFPSLRPTRSKTSFVDVIDRGLIAEIRRIFFHPILFNLSFPSMLLNWTYLHDDTPFTYFPYPRISTTLITYFSSIQRYPLFDFAEKFRNECSLSCETYSQNRSPLWTIAIGRRDKSCMMIHKWLRFR